MQELNAETIGCSSVPQAIQLFGEDSRSALEQKLNYSSVVLSALNNIRVEAKKKKIQKNKRE